MKYNLCKKLYCIRESLFYLLIFSIQQAFLLFNSHFWYTIGSFSIQQAFLVLNGHFWYSIGRFSIQQAFLVYNRQFQYSIGIFGIKRAFLVFNRHFQYSIGITTKFVVYLCTDKCWEINSLHKRLFSFVRACVHECALVCVCHGLCFCNSVTTQQIVRVMLLNIAQ